MVILAVKASQTRGLLSGHHFVVAAKPDEPYVYKCWKSENSLQPKTKVRSSFPHSTRCPGPGTDMIAFQSVAAILNFTFRVVFENNDKAAVKSGRYNLSCTMHGTKKGLLFGPPLYYPTGAIVLNKFVPLAQSSGFWFATSLRGRFLYALCGCCLLIVVTWHILRRFDKCPRLSKQSIRAYEDSSSIAAETHVYEHKHSGIGMSALEVLETAMSLSEIGRSYITGTAIFQLQTLAAGACIFFLWNTFLYGSMVAARRVDLRSTTIQSLLAETLSGRREVLIHCDHETKETCAGKWLRKFQKSNTYDVIQMAREVIHKELYRPCNTFDEHRLLERAMYLLECLRRHPMAYYYKNRREVPEMITLLAPGKYALVLKSNVKASYVKSFLFSPNFEHYRLFYDALQLVDMLCVHEHARTTYTDVVSRAQRTRNAKVVSDVSPLACGHFQRVFECLFAAYTLLVVFQVVDVYSKRRWACSKCRRRGLYFTRRVTRSDTPSYRSTMS